MLNSIYVIPGHTFFYWGFTLPKKLNEEYIQFFDLKEGQLVKKIVLEINGRKFPAKLGLARIVSPKYPNRAVLRIMYDGEQETLKALRKHFIYSYAATINKTKSALKELAEFVPNDKGVFRVKTVSKQRTDFDDMLIFMEEKNLFEYWKKSKAGKDQNFFVNFSRSWLPISSLKEYNNRVNVIYLLYHSKQKQLYVGKANRLGDRVKVGEGRIGLDKDWDKFMFFEIDPEYNSFIEQIEAFTIRSFASLMENDVGMKPLNEKNIKLVNRQLLRNK